MGKVIKRIIIAIAVIAGVIADDYYTKFESDSVLEKKYAESVRMLI